jgi:hypothetical protein
MTWKCRVFWFATVVILTCPLYAAAPLPDFSSEIRTASARLLDSSGGLSAIQSLVDILARMAQADARVPPAARVKLKEASDAFRTEASLEGQGVRLLHDAWKSISGGSAFVFPAGVKDIPAASARVRNRIDACLASLAAGNGDRAVRELLEAVLTTVTPMEVRGAAGIPAIRWLWLFVTLNRIDRTAVGM